LLAALTWAVSPLAVLMLAVAVVGMRRRKESLITLGLVALQVVLAHLFHGRGHFPFPWPEILAALVFSVGGAIFARDRVLRGIFVAYTALVVLSVAFQSQLGENAARLRFAALPLALLVVRGHRLWIAVPLVALCTRPQHHAARDLCITKGRESALAQTTRSGSRDRLPTRARRLELPRQRGSTPSDTGRPCILPRRLPDHAPGGTGRTYSRGKDHSYSDDLNMKTYAALAARARVCAACSCRATGLDYSSKREAAAVAAKLHFVTARDVSIYEAPRPQADRAGRDDPPAHARPGDATRPKRAATRSRSAGTDVRRAARRQSR
jgi:hypothetical protein